MTNDSFTTKTKLNSENIELVAPDAPGAIILYDKFGHINNLIVAENSIKEELTIALWNISAAAYFSFRETSTYLNVSKIIQV